MQMPSGILFDGISSAVRILTEEKNKMTDAACTAINTAIVRETGRIGPEIYGRVVPQTSWIAMTPRDVWPDSMGLVQTTMSFERMLPSNDSETWTDIAPSNGILNNCLPAVEVLKWGQTLRTWNLQKIAKESEEFCIEDLRSAFAFQRILQLFTNGLTTVSQWVWENRNRNEYIRMALHKLTENESFDITATAFDPTKPPTRKLSLGTLRRVRGHLLRQGAGEDAIGVTGNRAKIFALLTDENTISDLIRQDPLVRQDFQYAYMGKGALSPTLATQFENGLSYDGYSYTVDYWPARYEIVGGAYVRIQPFADPVATNAGTSRDLNPAYEFATYQVSVIHVPSVYTQRVPKPLRTAGGANFDAVNYMGDFKWVMEAPGGKCNPDGTIGRFRAVFASGSEPVHPEYGYVVMHLNCPPQRQKSNCLTVYSS